MRKGEKHHLYFHICLYVFLKRSQHIYGNKIQQTPGVTKLRKTIAYIIKTQKSIQFWQSSNKHDEIKILSTVSARCRGICL